MLMHDKFHSASCAVILPTRKCESADFEEQSYQLGFRMRMVMAILWLNSINSCLVLL